MKKLIFLGVLLAAVLFITPDAMAARVRNTNTGDRSKNTSIVEDEKKVRVRNFNLGLVVNGDLVGVNTGGNKANNNTGCCDSGSNCGSCCGSCDPSLGEPSVNEIGTGNGTVNISTNDKVNDTYVDIVQHESEDADSDTAINECTGPDSLNVAKIERERKIAVSNASIGGVVNLTAVGVNTGNNTASGNTGGNSAISTGNGSVTVKHSSAVNSTEVWIEQ
jgi:hypothetical protein